MDRVRVINLSLRCFTLGWLALIPFLGMLPAFLAMACFNRTRREAGDEWNPARGYLLWGATLAWCGLALSALLMLGAALVASHKLF
jgi:hypothetical protein